MSIVANAAGGLGPNAVALYAYRIALLYQENHSVVHLVEKEKNKLKHIRISVILFRDFDLCKNTSLLIKSSFPKLHSCKPPLLGERFFQ